MIKPPQTVFHRDTYCSWCGTIFAEQKLYPRLCFHCGNDTYRNPIPVVVAMIPVWKRMDAQAPCGWLVEQRGIEPKKGEWAFPSGYINFGETWQQAIVRELQEEVGLVEREEDFKLVDVVNSTNGNMLIFCAYTNCLFEDNVTNHFEPNQEVLDIQFPVLPTDLTLCFPTHNEMWAKYYDSME